MGRKLGWKGKIYYGTAGTTPVPPDTEITKVGDVELDFDKSEVEGTTRASGGVEEFIPGMLNVKVGFDIPTDKDDPCYIALRTAFLADTPISLLMLDEAAGEGPDGDVCVFAFGRSEPKNGQMVNKVALRPTPSTRAFSYHTPA